MGFMDKLMFWKKKDEFSDIGLGAGRDIGGATPDLGLGRTDDMSLGFGGADQYGAPTQPNPYLQQQPMQFPQQQFSQPAVQQQSHQDYTISKDIEIISSKLDAIRAGLESMNQRLANIERIAYGEQEPQRRRTW